MFAFDAFGNDIGRSGSTPTEHLYRGEQFDAGLGLYYLRERYFAPTLGRFTRQDSYLGSATDPLSLHKYAYANNDPIDGFDPSGMMTLQEEEETLDLQGILGNIARDQIRSYVDEKVFGCPEEDNGQPCLYDILVGGLIKAIAASIPSPSLAAVAMAGTGGGGRTHGHHTVPKYMCGHPSQQLVDLPVTQHKKLHAELYNFKRAVNIGAEIYTLTFRKKIKKESLSPIADIAQRKTGRVAVAAGLGIFYNEFGDGGKSWVNLGKGQIAGNLGDVFAVEAFRYAVLGHYNKGKCPEDDED